MISDLLIDESNKACPDLILLGHSIVFWLLTFSFFLRPVHRRFLPPRMLSFLLLSILALYFYFFSEEHIF